MYIHLCCRCSTFTAHVGLKGYELEILFGGKNDAPMITAEQHTEFRVRVGESVALTGINITDADMGDGTRWMPLAWNSRYLAFMSSKSPIKENHRKARSDLKWNLSLRTLLVACSIGRIYVEPDFLLSPLGTVEPLAGRLDGDTALRLRGSGLDLQALVAQLRFSVAAPVKPSLATRAVAVPETEAIVSYALSDTVTQQAGALRRHQVAGKVVDPKTDEPVQGAQVVLIAQDTWHDYLGALPKSYEMYIYLIYHISYWKIYVLYNREVLVTLLSRGYDILSPCALELIESVANCKAYAQNHSFPAFSFGVSRTGGASFHVLSFIHVQVQGPAASRRLMWSSS